MARQVSLVRTPQKIEDQSYQYTVVATGTEMVSEIFVLRRRPLDPMAGTTTDLFDHVAIPQEMVDLAVNAPLAGQFTFRKSTLVRIFATRAEADEDWISMQSEVNALIRALIAGDESLEPETVVLTG